MPRLDGQRLTRFLKQDELYAAIPIIILTGIASEDEGTILAFGADAYIAKGRIEDTMAHVLETFRWLEGRATPEETRNVVLGVEKLYPREMTRELLHIKGHLDTMLAHDGERAWSRSTRTTGSSTPTPPPAACSRATTTGSSASRSPASSRTRRHRGIPRRRPLRPEAAAAAAADRARPPRCCASPSRRCVDAEQLLRRARHPRGHHRAGAPRALAARADGGDRPERAGRALPARRRREDPRGEPGLRPILRQPEGRAAVGSPLGATSPAPVSRRSRSCRRAAAPRPARPRRGIHDPGLPGARRPHGLDDASRPPRAAGCSCSSRT